MPGGSSSTPSQVESLFQRSLDDLIKSLRSAPPSGEQLVVSRSLDEIRRELRSSDPDTKSIALTKLTYLSSIHHLDSSWAAFDALELLASPSLPIKRSAYLFASLSFHPSSTPLATHQLRKDLASTSPAAPSLALRLLSSADLSVHLSPELQSLVLSTSRPHIRRQAIAASLPLLSRSPDSAPLALGRLLSDPHSVAVGVFCQLSASHPRPLVPLAPEFHRILMESHNNWTLIKVLKIFARLALLEPSLASRMVDPICDHIRRSRAKSLVFECVRTVLTCLSDFEAAVRLAVGKIEEEFLSATDDPNLRFLGLHALSMLGPQHSWAVEENRQIVVKSLDDPDPNIRRKALQLVMNMVSESNVIEISQLLVKSALRSDPVFCNEIIGTLLSTCGQNDYRLIVVEIDWYVSLLGDMARSLRCAKGAEIEYQLVDIGLRVADARPELVRVARDLLIDPALLGNPLLYRVLSAAAWLSGEYAELSRNPMELLEALLQPRTNLLPPLVRAVYVQAVLKVVVSLLFLYINEQIMEAGDISTFGNSLGNGDTTGLESEDDGARNPLFCSAEEFLTSHDSIVNALNLIELSLAPLSECDQVEVQERARNVLGLVHMLRNSQAWNTKDGKGWMKDQRINRLLKHMQDVFSDKLGPVSAHGQHKVSVPDGLVLEESLSDRLAAILDANDIFPAALTSFSHIRRET